MDFGDCSTVKCCDGNAGALATGAQAYTDAWAEFAAHLTWLQLVLQRGVLRFRQRRPCDAAGLDGIAIFDSEIDAFLNSAPWPGGAPVPALDGLSAAIAEQARRILRSWDATPPDVRLPLRNLAQAFRLSQDEIALSVLCLAPEIDAEYGRIYAYLHNDIGRPVPSPALALDLLARDARDRLALRAMLDETAPLLRHRLMQRTRGAGALDGAIVLDTTVIRLLLGSPGVGALESEIPPGPSLAELVLASETRGSAERAAELASRGDISLICLHGPEGGGRRWVAAAIARRVGLRPALHRVADDDSGADGTARLEGWMRTVRLARACPVLDTTGVDPARRDRTVRDLECALAQGVHSLAFVLADTRLRPTEIASEHAVAVAVPALRTAQRAEAWRRFAAADGVAWDEVDLTAAAAVFPLTAGQIRRASRDAAARHRRQGAVPDAELLREACRAQAEHHIERLAQQVPTHHDFGDIVLPHDEELQLREVVSAVLRREQVLERWRFGEKVSVSPGVCILFSGPSGTGKTMAAGVVARALGMALYRIDLSRVISKYIGETEKHLEAVFDMARRAHAVLFFDEAEALLGKRSEVKDAHDRYANIEVAYLLQRMEAYEGVTILATNLRKNVDPAFLRRLHFCVEFPHPNEELRLCIWRKVWPDAALLAPDVDLAFMARQFDLAGGHIRNIALKAAYLAADDGALSQRDPLPGTLISMQHLIAATRREFQKLGRMCVSDEFGTYKHLLPVRT